MIDDKCYWCHKFNLDDECAICELSDCRLYYESRYKGLTIKQRIKVMKNSGQ